MGKFDKDRHQKEIAIRYCLAQKMVAYPEVEIPSASDLTDSSEVLTDIDVLAIEHVADGGLRRLIFDCKTVSKISAINRAFWASGVTTYTGCDGAFVILKKGAVFNHRLSALTVNVDLHDEKSFEALGEARKVGFNSDTYYQSSIDCWNAVYDAYVKNRWAEELYAFSHNVAPLSKKPGSTFRRFVSKLRAVCGQIDPAKPEHVAIFLDVLAAIFILWSSMGRDIRRFYDPAMGKVDFEKVLRYYIWGGKETFDIRQALRLNIVKVQDSSEVPSEVQEFPAWDKLVKFAGIVIAAPQDLFGCIHICRELSFRAANSPDAAKDDELRTSLKTNTRSIQFILALTSYLVAACDLPKDLEKSVGDRLNF